MSIISIKNLIKTYSLGINSFNAVNDISLDINNGEFISIMGPSGSGKSTFMNILGCLDMPTSGDYYLNGRNVTRLNIDELADIRNSMLGFVFQGFNLLPRTSALENVELPMIYSKVDKKIRLRKAEEALELVGLKDRLHHMPNQLSGGQQQRVAIARAIVNDASIIFADEPTGNLDTKTSHEVMNLFTNLNKTAGKTIILVTHEKDIADYSNRIISFLDGKIIKDEMAVS